MEVRLSKLMRKILSDPDAYRQLRDAMKDPNKTIHFDGKTYYIQIGPRPPERMSDE